MADVTLTITLPDIEAHALAIVAAGLGPEQFAQAYQHWLNHWKALEAYSPQVEDNICRHPDQDREVAMFDTARHVPLRTVDWVAGEAQAAIDHIAADALAQFDQA